MEKLLGRKFNNREECIEAVFSACRNDNFKPSIKNSTKGYQINFRCEFAEKAQRKKTPGVDSKRRKTENKSFGCKWSVHAIYAKDQNKKEWVVIDQVHNVHNEHQKQPQQQDAVTFLQSAEQLKHRINELPEEEKDAFKEYAKKSWESCNSVFQAVLGVSIEKRDAKVEEVQKGEETEKKDVTSKELVKVEKMGNVLKMPVKREK
jgi:hypothetical protein